jgi:type VI secretion system secreted protein Hcp
MRSFRSGRTPRIIGVGAASFLAASLAVGVATRGTDKPERPREVSISTALAAFTTANAYFLKIPSIPGDSTESNHANEIVVRTVSWGLTNSAGTASGGVFDNIVVGKLIDRASPALMKAAAAGTALGTIVLAAERNGSQPFTYAAITLTGAKSKSFRETGDLANGISETVGFAYTSIRLTYNKQNADGTSTPFTACWNLATHAAC